MNNWATLIKIGVMIEQMKNESKNGWNGWNLAIYRRNLGQNSRWNINLPLKINFGCWIKNWKQSGRWIAILPLESHLGCQINTGVIWAVKLRCMKEGKYSKKISDLSPINHRYIADILAIFAEISPLRFFSTKYRVDWLLLKKFYLIAFN